MIDYIKYTVDGKTYSLVNNGDNTWNKDETAPSVAGNYSILFEISENGIITYLDSSDPRYSIYLEVLENTERVVHLEKYVPDFIKNVEEFRIIYDIENIDFDKLLAKVEMVKNDMFISTASNDAITRFEKFVGIKGLGTLEQRKSYIKTLLQKGNKISGNKIKDIAKTIAGSDCIVTFFGSSELNNPESGYGLLRIQVLSPDNSKDYRYDDIFRTLKQLVPAHLKLLVIKYYSTWEDIFANYSSWSAIKSADNWGVINNYLPPQ